MTQNEFIRLMNDINKTPPINEAKNQFIEKRFKELGYSNLIGYQSIQYYYNELEKAYNGKETIFKGKVVKLQDSWGIVDRSAYFGMKYKEWENIKEVIFKPSKDITFIDYVGHDNELYNKNIEIIKDFSISVKDKFKTHKDYDLFNDMIAKYFCDIPNNNELRIELIRGSKTNVASIFNRIHEKLGKIEILKKDTGYFEIIRKLNHFSNYSDLEIYKAITR